jgi:hypothetical protein
LGAVALLVACAPSRYSKDQVHDRWVTTYVDRLDVTRPQAECIVDRWFAEITDDELRPLTNGAELSDAQALRIGQLAIVCGVGPVSAAA